MTEWRERVKEILRKLRDFILCCRKTFSEIDDVLDDIDDSKWFDTPIKPEE